MKRLKLTTNYGPDSFLNAQRLHAQRLQHSTQPFVKSSSIKGTADAKDPLIAENIIMLPMNSLVVHTNIRKEIDDQAIDELAKSIKSVGLLSPIRVFSDRSKYSIYLGQRRYLACKKNGYETMPCIITSKPNSLDLIYLQAIENEQSQTLSQKDQEVYITMLHNEHKQSLEEIAEKMGKSRGWVAQKLNAKKFRDKHGEKFEEANINITSRDAQGLVDADDEIINEAIVNITVDPSAKTVVLGKARKITAQKKGGVKSSKIEKKKHNISFGTMEDSSTSEKPETEIYSTQLDNFKKSGEEVQDLLFKQTESDPFESIESTYDGQQEDFYCIKIVMSVYIDANGKRFKLLIERNDNDYDEKLFGKLKETIYSYYRDKEFTQI